MKGEVEGGSCREKRVSIEKSMRTLKRKVFRREVISSCKMDATSLQKKTVVELREMCKVLHLRGYSKLKKAELVEMLTEAKADDPLEGLSQLKIDDTVKAVRVPARSPIRVERNTLSGGNPTPRSPVASGRVISEVSLKPLQQAQVSASSDSSAPSVPDKLAFYSKSKSTLPGKGTNEHVSNPSLYSTLASIKDWRKILSNFHVCPFEYQDRTWNSIEHVFQGLKIAIADPDKAEYFTIDSGHSIGQGDGLEARKHRKLVTLTPQQLKTWNLEKNDVMFESALEKYRVCEEALEVLLATGDAELWHIVSRGQPVRFEHLERVRRMLREE